MVVKVLVRVAVVCWEVCHWLSPFAWVGLVGVDVGGDVGSWEEVGRDTGLLPDDYATSVPYRHPASELTSVDTTADVVEGFAVRGGARAISDTAALVSSLVRGAVVGIKPAGRQGAVLVVVLVAWHSASRAGVERDLVLGERVDTFENVDFTAIRPVGAVLPPGRPCSTAIWHVVGVHDDHSASEPGTMSTIVHFGCRFDLHQVSLYSDGLSGIVDTLGRVVLHHGVAVAVDTDQALVPSGSSVDVVDGSVRGVVPVEELPVVKERVSRLKLGQLRSHAVVTLLTHVVTWDQGEELTGGWVAEGEGAAVEAETGELTVPVAMLLSPILVKVALTWT